jgi:tetratricopeptide (TPR) repeat protein
MDEGGSRMADRRRTIFLLQPGAKKKAVVAHGGVAVRQRIVRLQRERAIEWSERGMRLSPFDPWAFAAFDAQAMSHLLRGRHDDACRAAYRSVQANPAHSITYVQLAAALAKLGRLDEARAAAARVLELHPTFRYGRQFAGVACAPALAQCLGDALRAAGLPE